MRSETEKPRTQDLSQAYQHLVAGAETLLGVTLFFTERVLLTLVSQLYRRRLQQLASVLVDTAFPDAGGPVRAALIEAMAEAALGGHDLAEWPPVDNGYQVRCSQCNMTSWIGHDGMRYSLLEDECLEQHQ